MSFCSNCGSEAESESRYCGSCGNVLGDMPAERDLEAGSRRRRHLLFGVPAALALAGIVALFVLLGPLQGDGDQVELIDSWGGQGSEEGVFDFPGDIAFHPGSAEVYVSNYGDHRVQRFSSEGEFQGSWGSYGSGEGEFEFPVGIAIDDAGGEVYVADSDNTRIQRLTSEGHFINDWGSYGSGAGEFLSPEFLAIHPGTRQIYVASSSRIQRFTPTGDFLGMWGWGVDTGADEFEICSPESAPCHFAPKGSGEGQFSYVGMMDVHPASGDLYVTDIENHRVQSFSDSGQFLGIWGGQGTGAGEFDWPTGIAIDPTSGEVFVSDSSNHRIQRFTSAGDFLGMWGWGVNTGADELETCLPETLPCHPGIPGSGDGQLDDPAGLAIHPSSGDIYVVDPENDRIQRFSVP